MFYDLFLVSLLDRVHNETPEQVPWPQQIPSPCLLTLGGPWVKRALPRPALCHCQQQQVALQGPGLSGGLRDPVALLSSAFSVGKCSWGELRRRGAD